MISAEDSIAVYLEDFSEGAEIEVRLGDETWRVKALEAIPFGFKIALKDIAAGEHILKYGESIGLATEAIAMGRLVHVHNLEGGKGRGDLETGGAR